MIKFISSEEDASSMELVGMIALRQSPDFHLSYVHPGRIMSREGATVVVARMVANYDHKTLSWVFVDRIAEDEQHISISEIKALCDTAEEANRILQLSRRALDRFTELKKSLASEYADLERPDQSIPRKAGGGR